MAERRMFAKTIIDSDAFLDMPLSTQALYFHLSMRADDDGFLNNAKKIMRTIGANQNDYDLLIAKAFIIQFPDGICVIKHWRINNYLRNDRYKTTVYREEMSLLSVKENGSYSLENEDGIPLGIPNGYQMDTQYSIGKDSIDNNILSKDNIRSTPTEMQQVIDAWNDLGLSKVTKIVEGTDRYKWLQKRIKDYGLAAVLQAIDNVRNSSFLQNANFFSFDWLIRPNNFPKVLDGNYNEKNTTVKNKETNSTYPDDTWSDEMKRKWDMAQ